MKERNYWGYRIDTRTISFFNSELENGRLRQGWGWDKEQDLRHMTRDEGAGRNKVIMQRVKKDDILLIPRLPEWGYVTIAKATADWDKEYNFEISPGQSDYGHIFPAEKIRDFVRKAPIVDSVIRSTLRTPSRFWNVNHCTDAIEKIINAKEEDTQVEQTYESRMEEALSRSFWKNFNEKQFSDEIYDAMNKQFTAAEWEYALVHGLKMLFPFYNIEHVGGPAEKHHGTDILVKLPSILSESSYAIAIQVKDYEGFVGEDVIEQINKADVYWSEQGETVIDKIVIITRAHKDINQHLPNNTDGVKFYFAADLQELLLLIGENFIRMNLLQSKSMM